MMFKWTTLTVSDMEKSLAFYTQVVGLKVLRQFSPMPTTEIAFLTDGESATHLELMSHNRAEDIVASPRVSMGFTCDNLEVKMGLCKSEGYTIDENIYSPAPGMKFFYAYDPDGFKVQFILE